jgi:hypothetical protein
MKFALTVCAVLLAGAGTASAQQTCLHDRSETQVDRMRRQQAVAVARAINTAEHRGLSPRQPGQRYQPFDQLTMVPAIPAGFELQFHTDGDTYTLSLKDTRDPCKFAVFSDQEGLIYEAMPMRPDFRVTPLDTK